MDHDPIKVYDARWECGEFSDAQVARLVESTLLYARELAVDTVTIARDARHGAAAVLAMAAHLAVDAGFRTLVCPDAIGTPQSYFTALWACQQGARPLGLTITASHNPRQYVGIKFTVPPVAAIGLGCGPHGGLSSVRQLYHGGRRLTPAAGGRLELVDLSGPFIDFAMRAAAIDEGQLDTLSVVLDAMHGSAGPVLYRALQRCGARVVPLRLLPDGCFPTGSPNPTSRGKLEGAVALAAQRDADLVVGVDGDGDRIVFGDRRGLLSAAFAFVPVLRAWLGDRPGGGPAAPVLYDPKVNPLALAQWRRLGAEPVLFRNGHSQIKHHMMQVGASAAAEESGHYYHRVTLGGHSACLENSLLTILLLLGQLKCRPQALDELWAWQERAFSTGELNHQFESDLVRDRALAGLVEHFTRQGAEHLTRSADGSDLEGHLLRQGVTAVAEHFELAEGWYSGYLRIATNEKAVVRSFFCAGDGRQGADLERQARQVLEQQWGGRPID